MLNDLRHGVRQLLHTKGWTAVVVLSLALGIGANTALFSAVDGLFLTKLPVKDPDSLVRLRYAGKNDMATSSSDYGTVRIRGTTNARSTFSYPMFQQFVADNRTMDDLLACAPYGRVNVAVDEQGDIANSFISTGNYYRMLGLTANPGRTILPEDDKPGAPPVAVISTRYWRSRFGGDPRVVGKVVRINNVPVTIVGVIAPDLTSIQLAVQDGPDIGVPLALDGQLDIFASAREETAPRLSQPTYWWLQVVGRLKPGVTPAQVQANLESVFQHTARAGLDAYLSELSAEARSTSNNRNRTEVPHLRVDSASRGIYDVREADASSVTILSVVVLVLLIVCANVANLLLSRATARQKEISIRLSLGATRGRLIRQLLTESLLLAGAGCALGILVGQWGKQLLPTNIGQAAPFDWRVLGFAFGVAGATGILFGIAPAVLSPGFFDTMEMRLKAGRAFNDRDSQTAPKVAVINEAAVRKYFANENPIGQHIGSSIETSGQIEIVGVVRDAKYSSVREEPPATVYVPHLQGRFTTATYEVRAAFDPVGAVGSIREAVRQVDPNLPLMDVSTQAEQVEKRLTQERVFAQAYAMFGLLAVLLASIGLFGLMSYSVARRTNEIGIRMALGARAHDVLRLVMGESMILVAIGLGIGMAAAIAAGRLVASLLFGLAPTDGLTLALATTLMVAVSGFAAYLPARRAAQVDPMVALHYE